MPRNTQSRPPRRSPGIPGLRRRQQSPDESGKRPAPGPDQSGRGVGAAPPANRNVWWLVAVSVIVFMMLMVFSNAHSGNRVTLSEFQNLVKNAQIELDTVKIRDASIVAMRKADQVTGKPTQIVVPFNRATERYVAEYVMEITGNKAESKPPSSLTPFILTFGPFILLLVLIWFFVSRGLRNAGGGPGGMLGNFGKSRHRLLSKEMTGVTFADVAGIDEAKDEVGEIIEFLKNPKKFTKLGGRIPRGVLLIGEPGCGKTLLAKAIAGEADVPFFSISGSDFVEMFVGVGASRVRDLFKSAKENSPCIIFLDEIDAVGRRRGSGFSTGGHDEREQTLNAILVEMDGFTSADGVIVIAATNRADVLDPALIRPGRFDRQIVVPLPDVKGRLEILKVHAKKVKLGPDVDLERVARMTPMFSGADLAAIINEAAISATMHNKDFVEQEDLEEARDKVKYGRARKSRVREAEENRATAYHEAGHAVIQALVKDADPLHKVTIIPRGQALGATFSLPEKDRTGFGQRWLKATMRVLCGGRIAEQRAVGDVSSGAAQDISQVTQMARLMIEEWGMSERLGFVRYAGEDKRNSFIPEKDYSDETARIIDEEIRRLVDEAYRDAEQLLEDNWRKVEAVAEALLKYETLSGEEVHKVMRGEPLGRSSLAELLASQRRPSPPAHPPRRDADEGPEAAPGLMPSPA
ncbi:MAG TPA: ATP-dependent zinc metalloprotease FtsH [Phycisphaerales bacterium]|nr:ATP-dependent zinc metalloprotease FtsH [Phycisphaerales bacterium]